MNEHPRQNSSPNAIVSAFALILLGVIFLLRNLDLLDLGSRWWAFLLLVPLFYMGSRIMELRSRNRGAIPAEARGMLTGFLSVSLVMVILLLRLNWGDVWPLFIILAGVSLLFGRTGKAPSTGG